MFKPRLLQECIDKLHRITRTLAQDVVFEQQHPPRRWAEIALFERIERPPDQPIRAHHSLCAGKDIGIFPIIDKDMRAPQRIAAHELFDRIHDPGGIAHTGDDPGVGENLFEQGDLAGPGAIGVEDHILVGLIGIIALDHAAHDAGGLGLVHHARKFRTRAEPQNRAQDRQDRAGHGRMKAGVLQQDATEQGRARARQARDDMKSVQQEWPFAAGMFDIRCLGSADQSQGQPRR